MPDKKMPVSYLALITHVGLSMIVPILLGLFLGQWLDKLLSTKGILTLVLLLLGIAAAFRNLLRLGSVYKKGSAAAKKTAEVAKLDQKSLAERGNDTALNHNLSRSELDLSKLKSEGKSSESTDEAEIEVEEW
ncbi:MAG: AtpZ/AtpI family protein [Eubacteriales bacterium]|nr:AtpZ/AtpI family protein [Eubacteriales bacterium]